MRRWVVVGVDTVLGDFGLEDTVVAAAEDVSIDPARCMCETERVYSLPVVGSSLMHGVHSSVCLDDVGCCMLVATALGLAAVAEDSRVGCSAVWAVVMDVEAAAAVHNSLDMEAEDLAAGAVVLVDGVGSCARRYSNRWLPFLPASVLNGCCGWLRRQKWRSEQSDDPSRLQR